MSRRGKNAPLHPRGASTRFEKTELPKEPNLLLNPHSPVKIQQIHATAQKHVLTVVDDFRVFSAHGPRSRAATRKSAAFKQLYLATRAGKRHCTRKPR